MKKIYFLCLMLISNLAFSQMDTEHWIAPMATSTIAPSDVDSHLYLSTDQAIPFEVKIYSGGRQVNRAMISKGSPGMVDIDSDLVITNDPLKKFSQNTMGLYLMADQKFFAHLRIHMTNHAEIITSKGKAGLGKEFYAYTPENSAASENANTTVGITATEDGTILQLDNFRAMTLSNNEAVNGSTVKTINLNKYQSYILDCSSEQNLNGLSGLHIKSNKDITVTSGDFICIAPNTINADIFMDQASPVDRLGKDYIAVKGNGNLTKNMERVAIMATEDNTKVYLNGSATAAYTIPKKGDVYMTPPSAYRPFSVADDIYNLYIQTDKTVYAYQHLAGVNGSTAAPSGSDNDYASGGLNILPALSCFLPNIIDEFAMVDEIGHANYNTRLNIITQKNSTVWVNDVQLPETSAAAVSGNSGWVTYTVKPVRGNIKIKSTGAVTAGIAAGDGAVGYGGYFAGFNSQPVVAKGGDCSSGTPYLEVDNTYDYYQWYKDGQIYTAPDAQTFRITNPPPGTYYAVIEKNSCPGKRQSPSYRVLSCTVLTAVNQNICKTFIITPKLSKSPQTVNPSSVRIVTAPTKGTLVINPDSTLTYTPNSGLANGTADSFSYYFEGNDAYPDSETVTVNTTFSNLTLNNPTLKSCQTAGTAEFNLNNADLGTTGTPIIHFYENSTDATADNVAAQISDPAHYRTAVPKSVFAHAETAQGCTAVSEIKLTFYPLPNIDTSKYNATLCDDNLDGKITVKFSDITPLIVQNPSDFNVIYTVGANVLPDNYEFSSDNTVNVEVKSKNGCPSAFGTINFKIGSKTPLMAANPVDICDNDLDGTTTINLSDYSGMISNAPATFYTTLQDAKDKTNTISAAQNITGDKDFYLRFEDPAYCPDVATLNFKFHQPKKSDMAATVTICKDATIELHAGGGFDTYLWSNGLTTENSGQLAVGNYWVDLGSNGCVFRQKVDILAAADPIISEIKTTGKNIKVTVTGGNPPYQYSLDQINWQDSNEFLNLKTGRQRVFVKDKFECSIVSKEFLILNLVNAISPNGDGINDKLDYSDLSLKKDVQMEIYDRYGKLMYRATDKFIWDGTVAGRVVPTGTYWYMLKWTEPDSGEAMQYSGWVLVKNY